MTASGARQKEGTHVIEDQIRLIWERELTLDRIEDDDDFFVLGGHSLIMQRIQVAIKNGLGVEIPMDDLFRYCTIRDISVYINSMLPIS
jgi:acyl carrier protein